MDEPGKLKGGSRRYIMLAVEASLKRLRTDWIDLYQFHFPDPLTPMEETLRALDDLVRQGKVRYVGCSNQPPWRVVEAAWTARNAGIEGFVSCQDEYSLVFRKPEAELIPAMNAYGLGLLPYYPLASGLLTGKYRRGDNLPPGSRFAGNAALGPRYMTERNWERVEGLRAFAQARGKTLIELAFSWLAARPVVSSVIAGAMTPEQVEANVKSAVLEPFARGPGGDRPHHGLGAERLERGLAQRRCGCIEAAGAPMAESRKQQGAIVHGASELPLVTVDDYNLELRSGEGFLGDRANRSAFWNILDSWRERLSEVDEDPIADLPKKKISKKTLEELLAEGTGEQAGLVMGAIEDFARDFAVVIGRFLRHDAWKGTERIVVGGGMRGGRLGEMVIGRTSVILKGEGVVVDLVPIRHDPDEAGLVGASQLMPAWMFKGHDALLAVDIGGTNIRVGSVELKFDKSGGLKDARARKPCVWKHAEDAPSRTAAVARMTEMLQEAAAGAEEAGLALAPLIGVACPGVIGPGRRHPEGRPEPARRQLGIGALQSAAPAAGGDPGDRRPEDPGHHAQ